ncbi:hypothetical protein NXW62_13370 [Bacteroides fragilis]|nr:hypothetical protein [Bacteroides fragilis]
MRGKLKLLQEESESVQVTPADMPNAQRQFNGLHNSIQQMAREMPSLAMGPQMFFGHIQQPADFYGRTGLVPVRNKMSCRSQARKGTPVWKQVLSSLFSWQTASFNFLTGIMLLVMYGTSVYLNTSMNKDEFCKDFTKHGDSQVIRDVHVRSAEL